MTKPILFLQFRTDQSLEHEQQAVLQHGHIPDEDFEFVNILDPCVVVPSPDDLNKYRAVISGGSAQFDISKLDNYEFKDRLLETKPLFEAIVEHDFPCLSICFGHQLMAELMGGKVEADPKQAESGTLKVFLTPEGKKASIYNGMPRSFYAVVGHKDSVTKLPDDFVVLATSDRCRVESYRVKSNIFTTQYHPELNTKQLVWRLMQYPEYAKGKSLEQIKEGFEDITWAPRVLSNFIDFVDKL